MAKRFLTISAGFVLFITAVAHQTLGADAAAVISSLSGKVEVRRAGQQGLTEARLGEKLFDQDVLYTRKGARASVLLSDGALMVLSSDHQIAISSAETERGSVRFRLSTHVMKGLSGLFSLGQKREIKTLVAGIRKKEEGPARVRVLYPRNSVILTPTPSLRWQAKGSEGSFTVSLTLKGMQGSLWSLRTGEFEVPFPVGQKPLERGQTYFLRVENDRDATIADEVYFRVLDEKRVRQLQELEAQMAALKRSDPDDLAPSFILAGFYKKSGISHRALEEIERLEKADPDNRFILEEKAELLADVGLTEEWQAVTRKLEAMN